ncbi:type II toxin-antitoxin system RelE family toxin [Microcystis sp.]|uniref:type II toxin-antitoxin system RelE family toxin n=1 Tax=Microcystis sp. TaxID=1127 RepID=UPI00391BBA59
MSYSVTFEPESITDLDLITDFIRLRILNKIKWLAINFEQITPLLLTREWSGFYKLRLGDDRIIYEFDRESRIIIRVGHRSEVYD